MKKNLLIITALLVFAVAASDAFAFGRNGGYGCPGYGPGSGFGGGFRHLNYLQEELGLTDQQVKQIFDIGTKYRERRFENRNNPEKLGQLRDDHRKAVEAVFTKEQLDKFNKLRYDRGRRW